LSFGKYERSVTALNPYSVRGVFTLRCPECRVCSRLFVPFVHGAGHNQKPWSMSFNQVEVPSRRRFSWPLRHVQARTIFSPNLVH